MRSESSRRTFIASLAAMLAPLSANAATEPLCPTDPSISDPSAPLTIDTHAHFFNGSDLQIRAFLSGTAVGKDSELT